MRQHLQRKIARRYLYAKTFKLNIGDPVLVGKYKNQKGYITGFGVDDKGDNTVTVEIDRGEGKKPKKKTTKLFKIRFDDTRKKRKKSARKLDTQAVVLRSGVTFDAKVFMGNLMATRKIQNTGTNKPKGAFWTSTYSGGTSDWIDWCSRDMPYMVGSKVILLEPQSAKILHIRTKQDLQDVLEIYPWEEGQQRYGLDLINWEEISQDYDAVHVSRNMARTYELGAWDTESTAWFRPKLRWKSLVDVNNKCQMRVASRYVYKTKVATRWLQQTKGGF